MKRLFLIRHGEIPSNRVKKYAGWSEEELTDSGIKQAQEAADKIESYKVDAIFASPLRRTVQTAQIIGQKFGLYPQLEAGLGELKMGPWEGKYETEIANEYPAEWLIWNTNPACLRIPGRETLSELLDRALKAIEKIQKATQNCQVTIIVTHVAIIRVLLLHYQKKSLNFYKTIDVPNGLLFDLSEVVGIHSVFQDCW